MSGKIAFPELVRMLADATSTTARMSELFLKELFATVSQALIDGERVVVKGLGTFEVDSSASSNRLTFTPDKALAETINQPFAAFQPVVLSDAVTDEMLNNIENEELGIVDEHAPEPEPASGETIGSVGHGSAVPAPESTPAPEEPQPEVLEPEIVEGNDNDTKATDNAATTERGLRTAHHFIKLEFEQEKREVAHKSFIKGLAAGVLATVALGLIVWASWTSGRNSVLSTIQPPVQADSIAEAAADETTTEIAVDDITAGTDSRPATPPDYDEVVTDTCTATMYLTRMSTKHYGKPDFWIYIYEENRAKIDDPNNIKPGTVVVIPPAAKYAIDPDNWASIARARQRTYDVMTHN